MMSRENKLNKTDDSKKIKIYEAKIKDLILAYKNVSKEKELLQDTLTKLCSSENIGQDNSIYSTLESHNLLCKEKIMQMLKLVSFVAKQKGDLETALIEKNKQGLNYNDSTSISATPPLGPAIDLQEKLKDNIKEKNALFQKNIFLETELIQKELDFANFKDKLHVDYKEREDCLLKLCKEKEERITNLEEKITQIIQTTAIYEDQKTFDSNKIAFLEAASLKEKVNLLSKLPNEINLNHSKKDIIRKEFNSLSVLSKKVACLKTNINVMKMEVDLSNFNSSLRSISIVFDHFSNAYQIERDVYAKYQAKCNDLDSKLKELKESGYIKSCKVEKDKHKDGTVEPSIPKDHELPPRLQFDPKQNEDALQSPPVEPQPRRSSKKGSPKEGHDRRTKHKPQDVDIPRDYIFYYQQEIEGKEKLIKYLKSKLSTTEGMLRDSQQNASDLELLYAEQLKFLKGELRNLEAGAEFRRELGLAQVSQALGHHNSSLFLYMRNLFLNYLKCEKRDVKARKSIIRAISTVLKFTPEEVTQINRLIVV